MDAPAHASTVRLKAVRQLRSDIDKAFPLPKVPPSTDLQILPVIRKTLERAKCTAEENANDERSDTNMMVAVMQEYVDSVDVVDMEEIEGVVDEVLEEVLKRRCGDYYDGPPIVRAQHTLEVLRKVMKRFEGRPVLKEDVLKSHRDAINAQMEWDRDVIAFLDDNWPRNMPPPWD